MKRLTLLCLAVALLLPATANAQLTMQMSNGWAFTFAGNVNAFWVFTKRNSQRLPAPAAVDTNAANSSVRTGLLPAFATFEARGKEAGLNLGIHFGFAPQIQNAGIHDNFGNGTQAGAQIDMRQVYLTIGFKDGSQILAGRELGLFGRQNIVNDMTLYGVGAVGVGGGQGGGTTLGRIGYGYIYPNFNAQLTYSSKGGGPAQVAIGLFQPSRMTGGYTFTPIPRVEAEVTWNRKSGNSKWLVWAGGLWQSTKNAPAGGNTVSAFGGTLGIKGDISDLSVVVNGYIGKGLGTVLMFGGTAGGGVAAGGTELRTSDGGYAQLMYRVDPKWTAGASWGFSRLKNNSTAVASGGDGNSAVRTQWTSTTLGLYNQWSKSLKLVFEGTREQTGIGAASPAQVDVSAGFMLFF